MVCAMLRKGYQVFDLQEARATGTMLEMMGCARQFQELFLLIKTKSMRKVALRNKRLNEIGKILELKIGSNLV